MKGGFFFPVLELGAIVSAGDLFGTVTDPESDLVHEIRSPQDGGLIGMAEPQVVLSGYSLFHLGHGSDTSVRSRSRASLSGWLRDLGRASCTS